MSKFDAIQFPFQFPVDASHERFWLHHGLVSSRMRTNEKRMRMRALDNIVAQRRQNRKREAYKREVIDQGKVV